MKDYLRKMRGSAACPPRPNHNHILYSWFGGFLGIALVGYLTYEFKSPLIMAPFGATCVLAFGVPDSPLAQPRNIIGGHFISTLVGLVLLGLLGNAWWVLAVSVATAIGLMQLTRTVHPPAGADPLVVITTAASWRFLFLPVLAGSILLVLCALLVNNAHRRRNYPNYWL
jgi:CBS-domain-containing membrane protein